MTSNSNLAVPYWRWSVNPKFPAWLLETTPAFGHAGPGSAPVPREIGVSGTLPIEHDVSEILANYVIRSGQGDQINEYEKFTYCLEGWADNLPAHNHVHVWVGGIMNNTSYSPSDPIFWLHHCEIDRLWWVWQQSHSNVHPSVPRESLQLTPWTESNYHSVIDIKTIGYSYDRVSI